MYHYPRVLLPHFRRRDATNRIDEETRRERNWWAGYELIEAWSWLNWDIYASLSHWLYIHICRHMGICKAATNDPTWMYYIANKNTKIQIPFRSKFCHSSERISYCHGIDRFIIEAKDYLDFRFRRSSLAARWYLRCILRWTTRFMHSMQSELNWIERPDQKACITHAWFLPSSRSRKEKKEKNSHTHLKTNCELRTVSKGNVWAAELLCVPLCPLHRANHTQIMNFSYFFIIL